MKKLDQLRRLSIVMPTYLNGLLGGDDGKLRDSQAIPDSLVDDVQQLGITALKCTRLQKIL